MNIRVEEIFTVSRLNREARLLLEGSFSLFWIEGEISNFVTPQSGHWYFSLKDSTAQIRCAMFKLQNRRLNISPQDGMQVLLKAQVSLYEGRGDFQLIVEHMEEAGIGKLQQAFEALKKRLSAAGLFAIERKRKLPAIPRRIGVITSPTGAAIRDILHVLCRRFAAIPIIIYPTLVQGELAAANIVNAIQTANRRLECDLLIVARGGGSLEDLWPFNEEIVAHAIHQSHIPIITGIGHEIDYTIADFVADVRAPTPSAAAELVTLDAADLIVTLEQKKMRFIRTIKQTLESTQQQLQWLAKHLQQLHPKRQLLEQTQQLDRYETLLVHLQQKLITSLKNKLDTLQSRMTLLTPIHSMQVLQQHLILYEQKLYTAMSKKLQMYKESLGSTAGKLDTLSPLTTLKRGFAIVSKDNKIIYSTDQVKINDNMQVQLHNGRLNCIVTEVE